jgi:uncharacterized repeat protein (TIGR01451 family)
VAITQIDRPDTNPANNSAAVSLYVPAADLVAGKTASTAAPNELDAVTFVVSVSNRGPQAASGVRVADLLPAGLTFSNAAPSQGSYTSSNGVWAVGALGVGGVATMTVTSIVNSGTGGRSITNMAAATATQGDPTPADNTARVAVVVRSADLSLAKRVSNRTPNESNTVVYTIAITNHWHPTGFEKRSWNGATNPATRQV